MASPTVLPRRRARIRIQSIDIDLKIPAEYPICLKLLLSDQVHQRLEQVSVGQALHWNNIKPIDTTTTDVIELRAYEAHTLRRRVRILGVKHQADRFDDSSTKLTLEDYAGLVPCTITFAFPSPEEAAIAPHAAQKLAAKVGDLNPGVLESMGKARHFVDTILKVGAHVSELNPVAKATLGLCKMAWEKLEEQDKYDNLTIDLIHAMGSMLPFVDEAKDQARVASLKSTIVKTLKLIEDASHFIIQYRSDGLAVRAVKAFTCSTAREQVDEFVKQFDSIKEEFDRGLLSQVVSGMGSMLIGSDRETLLKLVTSGANYDPSAGCLEGTRMNIRTRIQQWTDQAGCTQPLFWLYGLAGCGKSTVSRSICKTLEESNRLGAAFFCKRDKEQLSNPSNVLSTIAARLAFCNSSYGARLITALHQKPVLVESALETVFKEMILRPLRDLNSQAQWQPAVIVVDALDECGTADSRSQLLEFLLGISELIPPIKIIITSRPNEEIAHFFNTKGKQMPRCDLFQEDPTSVRNDISAYIRYRLTQLLEDNEELGPRPWLDDNTVERLAANANGLFIWAQTACSVICNSVDPDGKIEGLLAQKPSEDARSQLSLLYTTVLDEALGGKVDDVDNIKRCITGILISRCPLSDTSLFGLLADRVTLYTLRLVIRRLASVLYRDQHGIIRVIHKSFADYMMEWCPSRYRIEEVTENLQFAISCMRIMIKELKFNICQLEDSRLYNHEVPGLANRIRCVIRPHLWYSCLYWMNHVASAPFFDPTLEQHQMVLGLLESLFMGHRAIYWIEVLSLVQELPRGEYLLLRLWEWMKNPAHRLSKRVQELQWFMIGFSPVFTSTPQLYVSAIAFGSGIYGVVNAIKDQFPNTVHVTNGTYIMRLAERSPHPQRFRTSFREAMQYSRKIPGRDIVDRPWTFQTHNSGVVSISLSSDGRRIVSGSRDNKIRVWDLHTGCTLADPLGSHADTVTSVAFSPDGQYIASGSYNSEIKLWDTQTGVAINDPFTGHTGAVTSVAFSPDGQRIASGSRDQTIRQWHTYSGKPVLDPLRGHTARVASVSFSPDGLRIVSGSWDNTVRLWNAHIGSTTLGPLQGHSNRVLSVSFSYDGQYIVSASRNMSVRVWDANTGVALFGPLQGHTSPVTSVAFSPDGKLIASGSVDGMLRLWSGLTGSPLAGPLLGHARGVTSVVFSLDGNCILSGSEDGSIRVWDTSNPSIPPSDLPPDFLSSHRLDSPVPSYQLSRSLSSNGWLRDSDGKVLFWLPPYYRRWRPDHSTLVISNKALDHCPMLDFTAFRSGTEWSSIVLG